MASRWGPNGWSFEPKTSSVQGVILLMPEIDIQKRSNRQHAVSWSLDGLDRILDDPGLYPGMCVPCCGRTGYDTYDGLGRNYGVPLEEGLVHREMPKTFAYFAKADEEGILVRSLMENSPEDFGLLYKRRVDKIPIVIGGGFFAYGNITFMSQIELPDGTHAYVIEVDSGRGLDRTLRGKAAVECVKDGWS